MNTVPTGERGVITALAVTVPLRDDTSTLSPLLMFSLFASSGLISHGAGGLISSRPGERRVIVPVWK